MLVLLIVSGIIGIVVAIATGFSIAGWIVGILFFVCGLPFALLGSFVHGEVSYTQDREDYRQFMSDLAKDRRAQEREAVEDLRTDRITEEIQKHPTRVYYDNRKQQIHVHGRA